MANLDHIYQYLRSADGVNQLQRSLPALDPNFVLMDERKKSDLINFVRSLSDQIRFYNLTNISQGNWHSFFEFPDPDNFGELQREDWPPHLALFMAFLHLYSIAQQDLNELTGRHLKYFYENVLQLQRKPAQPDQVHVIFELIKNAPPVLLPAGTLLDAGKTPDGKTSRLYSLDSDLVVNQAVIQSLKSSFTEENSSGNSIIFKTDDATQVKSDTGLSWRPFGSAQLDRSPEARTMTEVSLGFALASPALLLSEGERTITITLQLQSAFPLQINQGLTYAFDIALTGEKGWIVPAVFQVDYHAPIGPVPPQLILNISILPAEDPLIAYNETLHGSKYLTQWPLLRCLVKPGAYQLESLRSFIVQKVEIEVNVKGLRSLVLQNDETIQPIDKPILAFGPQPAIGNNFYIGSAEVFSKTLQSLSVSLEWKELPENFINYYEGYDNPNISYDKFLADVFLLADRSWDTLLFYNQTLFNSSSQESIKKLLINELNFTSLVTGSGFKRNPGLGVIEKYDALTNQGFIKLVLKGPNRSDAGSLPVYAPFEAFGHKEFPVIYTHKAIDLSQNIGNGLLPNQPYTPTLKSVSLDYSARESFIPSIPNTIDQFFLLDIFGNAEVEKNDTARLIPLYPQQGALYIGLKNAHPPQSQSLLFQIEKGDFPGAALLEKEDLAWSYLSGTQWHALTTADILEEATDNLQKPGLIRVTIGSDASTGGTLMTTDLHWLRITANQRSDGAGAILEIASQAARATVVSGDSNTRAISAGTITRLVNRMPAIKTIRQDYPSINGLPPENDAGYFRRSSERLRHRNRAVNTWDFERLVLEAFPEVFKIKCLPHIDQSNHIAPGHIKLILIPDLRFRQGNNPLQPLNNLAFLRNVETLLKDKYLGSFVIPHAANPEYETLLVDCKVAFLPGFDPGFYSNQLQEEIRRFLSPWAYEEGRDIIFGGKVYKSEILAFIEGRTYVDYLVDFQLFHRFEGPGLANGISCMTIGLDFIVGSQPSATIGSSDGTIEGAEIGKDFVIGEPTEIAIATRPDAILVSNAVHRIEALLDSGFQCKGVSTIGIGQMIIGLDFIPIS